MSGIPSTDNCFAFIQARLGSTRLTGKVLKNLPSPDGPNLLEHIHSRLIKIMPNNRIVFLIPETDLELADFLNNHNYNYFAGPLHDVRERYRLAAKKYSAEIIFRLTGDNPFVDIRSMELILEAWNYAFVHKKIALDLVSCSPLPLGMGIESFSVNALMSGDGFDEERHREHVSLHIKENPSLYNIIRLPTGLGLEVSNIRCTIDEIPDFEMMEKITVEILKEKESVTTLNDKYQTITAETVLELYHRKSELFSLNQKVEQVRFPLPQPIPRKKQKILIIAGNPKLYGYGHWERMSILASHLCVEGFNLSLTDSDFEIQSTSEKYDILIVDKRDTDYSEIFNCPILYIDSNRPGRSANPEKHIDILPNNIYSTNLKEFRILISSFADHTPFQQNLKSDKKLDLIIYAGSLDSKACKILDEAALKLFQSDKILRVGGSWTGLVPWQSRITKSEWWQKIRSTRKFLSYFGQGVMEAISLNLEVATYSISNIHKELSMLLYRETTIPWLGDIVSDAQNSQTKNLSSQNELEVEELELKFVKSSKQFSNTSIDQILLWIDRETKESRIG